MRAIYPSKDPLTISNTPPPQVKPFEVLIKVHAAGVNRADILQRKGYYPPPLGESDILGLEVAGEVVEVGNTCTQAQAGDRVFALLAGGGYAEYVAVHERLLMPIPANLTFIQAAAIAEVFLTAYQALVWLAHLNKDETVLIHAGAGGVGTAAIQLTKQIGARIVVTTGNEQKMEACKKLGADYVINYKATDFVTEVSAITNNDGVNVIIDSIGADYFAKNLQALAIDGRLIMLALQSGSQVDHLKLNDIIGKRFSIIGSTLRNRDLEYKIKLVGEFSKKYLPQFEIGELVPIIHGIFDWENAEAALQLLKSNNTIGKIILTGM